MKFLKYIPEKDSENTAIFLANFRFLCNDAEIDDPEKIKNLLSNSYLSNKFFKIEFTKRVNGISLLNDLLKIFDDVVLEELEIIKHGSLVNLKHVATSRYLFSYNILAYYRRQVVGVFF